MLYRIKNKSGLVIGVHECGAEDIRDYLKTLPRQSAPYFARALPAKRRHVQNFIVDAVQGWPMWTGVPLYVGVFLVLRHFGVV